MKMSVNQRITGIHTDIICHREAKMGQSEPEIKLSNGEGTTVSPFDV